MKVIMLSTDIKIFDKGSFVRSRMIDYGTLVDNLLIILPTWRGDLKDERLSDNVLVKPVYVKNRYWAMLRGPSVMAHYFRKTFGTETSDWIVSSQDPFEVGYVAWRVARRLGYPLQLQVHTDFINKFFVGQTLRNRWRVWLARFLIRRAHRIRVVSKRIEGALIEQWGIERSRIDVLPIRADLDVYRAPSESDDLHNRFPQYDHIILMAGRLAPEKNIPLALLALGNIVAKHPKTVLVIVGSGPEKPKLEKIVHKYRLGANVVFLPWSAPRDLARLYKSADMFLVTSNYEGYGLTLVEAAASGLPIITTDVGLVGDVLSRESLSVLSVGDKNGIVKAIDRMIKVPDLRALLADRAREEVARIPSKDEYLARFKKSWETCTAEK